jgi:hypothetical protein
MFIFYIFQILFINMLFRYLSRNTALDIYRSFNCLLLSFRGIYYLLLTPYNQLNYTMNTCYMYLSYTSLDLYYLYITKSKRIELIFHHIFTIIAYIQLYATCNLSHESSLSHIFLLAELLSVCNYIFRGSIFLTYWRLLVILFIRIPIWIYMIYTTNLLYHTFSKYLTQFASICMPILDIYFLYTNFKLKDNKRY